MVNPQWSDFQRPNQQESDDKSQQELTSEEAPENKEPDWGDFETPTTYQGEPDPTVDEDFFDTLKRNMYANASRLFEQTAGRTGNTEKFLKDVTANYPQSLGVVGWATAKLIGKGRWENIFRGDPEFQMAPTSKQIKRASEEITGGYTSPKNEYERAFQEFTEDVGALYTGQPESRGKAAFNKLLVPAAANVTKETVKYLGFGEDKANLAKIAVWLPLTLAGNVNAKEYASELMNKGREGLPEHVQADVPRFMKRLGDVRNKLLTSDPRNAAAIAQINQIERDIANGNISGRSLMRMYDGVNAAKQNRSLFELGSPGSVRYARGSMNEINNAIRSEIFDIGANYPDVIDNWQNGVNAWATIHQSNAVTNYVQDVAKGPYAKMITGPAAGLFGVTAYGASKVPLVSATGTVAAPALYKTGQTLYRMWNNPTLANYYWNAVNAALSQNRNAFISNYNKLNKGLEKSISAEDKKKSKK